MPHVILAVTKDVGAAQALIPIAEMLRQHDCRIFVACEGLSIDLWRKSEFPITLSGSVDFTNKPYSIPTDLVSDLQPDLVLTGLSRPIYLEEKIGLQANHCKIPLIWVEDLWECHVRSTAIPQGIITLDPLGEQLIRQKTHLKQVPPRVCEAGNSGILSAIRSPVPDATQQAVDDLRRRYDSPVVLIAGQGSFTGDILRVGIASVAMSHPSAMVIVRLHPKYLPKYAAEWEGIIEEAKQRFPRLVFIELDGSHSTNDLARLADVTISTSSTTLLISAASGKIPVSILTEATTAGLTEIIPSLTRYPLVTFGAALQIREPDVLPLGPVKAIRQCQESYFKHWSTASACAFVRSFLPTPTSAALTVSLPHDTVFLFDAPVQKTKKSICPINKNSPLLSSGASVCYTCLQKIYVYNTRNRCCRFHWFTCCSSPD